MYCGGKPKSNKGGGLSRLPPPLDTTAHNRSKGAVGPSLDFKSTHFVVL